MSRWSCTEVDVSELKQEKQEQRRRQLTGKDNEVEIKVEEEG